MNKKITGNITDNIFLLSFCSFLFLFVWTKFLVLLFLLSFLVVYILCILFFFICFFFDVIEDVIWWIQRYECLWSSGGSACSVQSVLISDNNMVSDQFSPSCLTWWQFSRYCHDSGGCGYYDSVAQIGTASTILSNTNTKT